VDREALLGEQALVQRDEETGGIDGGHDGHVERCFL
jgi:hypothetical protein